MIYSRVVFHNGEDPFTEEEVNEILVAVQRTLQLEQAQQAEREANDNATRYSMHLKDFRGQEDGVVADKDIPEDTLLAVYVGDIHVYRKDPDIYLGAYAVELVKSFKFSNARTAYLALVADKSQREPFFLHCFNHACKSNCTFEAVCGDQEIPVIVSKSADHISRLTQCTIGYGDKYVAPDMQENDRIKIGPCMCKRRCRNKIQLPRDKIRDYTLLDGEEPGGLRIVIMHQWMQEQGRPPPARTAGVVTRASAPLQASCASVSQQAAGDRRASVSLQAAGDRRASVSPQAAGDRRASVSQQAAGDRRDPPSARPRRQAPPPASPCESSADEIAEEHPQALEDVGLVLLPKGRTANLQPRQRLSFAEMIKRIGVLGYAFDLFFAAWTLFMGQVPKASNHEKDYELGDPYQSLAPPDFQGSANDLKSVLTCSLENIKQDWEESIDAKMKEWKDLRQELHKRRPPVLEILHKMSHIAVLVFIALLELKKIGHRYFWDTVRDDLDSKAGAETRSKCVDKRNLTFQTMFVLRLQYYSEVLETEIYARLSDPANLAQMIQYRLTALRDGRAIELAHFARDVQRIKTMSSTPQYLLKDAMCVWKFLSEQLSQQDCALELPMGELGKNVSYVNKAYEEVRSVLQKAVDAHPEAVAPAAGPDASAQVGPAARDALALAETAEVDSTADSLIGRLPPHRSAIVDQTEFCQHCHSEKQSGRHQCKKCSDQFCSWDCVHQHMMKYHRR